MDKDRYFLFAPRYSYVKYKVMRYSIPFFLTFLFLTGSLFLSACGNIKTEAKYPTVADRASTNDDIYAEAPSIFGSGGLNLFGGKKEDGDTGIGVNSYLWRASLDTISFMPLDNADPFGGVITTDWYSPPATPNERLKLNVLILSKSLKSDGVQVKVFQQQQTKDGWRDVTVAPETERELENAILTRARQLRVADIDA